MAEAEESPSGGGDDKKVKDPVGFRFKPTLRELVEFYLLPKLLNKPTVPNVAVIEADAYERDPEILTKRYEARGADENWYFLSPRSRRYPGGDRPTRRTADNRGRWKPSTGQSKPGKDAASGHSSSKAKKGLKKNLSVGAVEFTENTLAYYLGEPRNETKTKWLMHELTVPEPEKEKDLSSPTAEKSRDHMLLNKYVMCRIYKSPLKKWKELENEEGSTSSALTCDEEVPTSSRSVPVLESSGEISAAPIKRAGKRPAAEQPSGHANAPNKRASSQKTMPPPGPPVPTTHANGGGGMRAPPTGVGAGAAGYYHGGVPGLPQLVQWPPATYSSMQGPVQLQQPRLVYGQPPVQGPPPVLKLFPQHRASAAAIVPDSLGRNVMMPTRPPNLAAGQPVQPPSFLPRPTWQQQQQQQQETENMMQQRVYAQLIAELKLQKAAPQERSPCAGQQQIMPAASTQPACFDEGASHHPAAEKVMVPRTQLPAPHNLYPCSGGVQQLQQSSPAIPASSAPPCAAAPVEATPAADDAQGKLPVPGDAKEGSEEGNCYNYTKQLFADLAAVEN